MLMPLMGFFLMLIVVGGIGSLVVVADPSAAKKAPYTFAALFAGVGVYALMFLAVPIDTYINRALAEFVASAGIFVGSIGGAILGHRIGWQRSKRAEAEIKMREKEAEENL